MLDLEESKNKIQSNLIYKLIYILNTKSVL